MTPLLSFLIFAVVVLIVAGLILWGIEQVVPPTWPFRNAVRALIIAGVLIWLVVTAYQRFGR